MVRAGELGLVCGFIWNALTHCVPIWVVVVPILIFKTVPINLTQVVIVHAATLCITTLGAAGAINMRVGTTTICNKAEGD